MTFQSIRYGKKMAAFGLLLVATFCMGRHVGISADKPSDAASTAARGSSPSPKRTYHNQITPIENRRFEAPPLIEQAGADLSVRAWRFSYNARGIIEVPNCIRADRTAAIMVHPWGIDDGQGWRTPEPAGVADFCTVEKNHLAGRHTAKIVNPLLKRLRKHVNLVLYSLRGSEHPAHKHVYHSARYRPTAQERARGIKKLRRILSEFEYRGEPLPAELTISDEHPFRDYFQQFPEIDAGPKYNNNEFWDLPIPACSDVDVHPDDVVYYDADGYAGLRDFLKEQGVEHVILTDYATDMCFYSTTAGYQNLSRDFNVFLVGDATLATFPANNTPRYATNAHISYASLNQFVTQCSWINFDKEEEVSDK